MLSSSATVNQIKRQASIGAYVMGGRKPWSRGYNYSKFDFIRGVLNDKVFNAKFKDLKPLPDGFGYGYDERVVEYPWALTRIPEGKGRLLDAGSVFNFKEIVEDSRIANKDLTIFTLAPESHAFWNKKISYHYGDLRELPFKDNWFNTIDSLSTLGHVGMDTRIYTKEAGSGKVGLEAEQAVKELIRVLKPGGKLLISVVFGKRQIIEWNKTPFAEQFDSPLLKDLLRSFSSCKSVSTVFYKYTQNGWDISTEEGCQGLEYFNIHTAKSFAPDGAAAARAVALIEAVK
jgi:SAM-dependent methyltransferase